MTRKNEKGAVLVLVAIALMAIVAVISLVLNFSSALGFRKLAQRVTDNGVEVAGLAILNSGGYPYDKRMTEAKDQTTTFIVDELTKSGIPGKFYRDESQTVGDLTLDSGKWHTSDPAPCGAAPCFESNPALFDALRVTIVYPQLRLLFGADAIFPNAEIRITQNAIVRLDTGKVILVIP